MSFNKKIPQNKIEELANLKFIEHNEIALFLGKTGTGKTHLAIAIGIKAAQAGHSVFNRDVEEWPQVFSDPVLAGAAIDRMFEDANICLFEGPSHRMKGRIMFNEIDKE